MSVRALLFSKSAGTAESLAAVFQASEIRAEVCSDIFDAIDKGTKQSFPCLIVDWLDQPEASFLLRRARESASNRNAVAIAIVEHEPSPGELRDNRLDFLLHRPIAIEEARVMLAKACQQVQMQPSALDAELGGSQGQFEAAEPSHEPEGPKLVSAPADEPKSHLRAPQTELEGPAREQSASDEEATLDEEKPDRPWYALGFRSACAAVLAFAAVFCLWRSRETVRYLAHTHEGIAHVLQESMAALLYSNRSGAQPVASVTTAQQDAYLNRTPGNTHGHSSLGVVWAEATLPETGVRLPKAFDFPLPAPKLLRSDPPPLHVERAQVPESIRGSAPIGPPVVVTAGPAQMMPVSTPVPQTPQFSEPVRLSEEAARAMLVHSVDPLYPSEAAAQKLQGAVVLQALIGRDGSVQDLKIIRGYFVLGRAAVAAVKQWRFQPYSVNGHAAQTQTTLTINFSRPQS
jgi:TonB family protein